MKLPPDVRAFFAKKGKKGGKIGGKATGPCKNRGPEHYARMAQIRARNRKIKEQLEKPSCASMHLKP